MKNVVSIGVDRMKVFRKFRERRFKQGEIVGNYGTPKLRVHPNCLEIRTSCKKGNYRKRGVPSADIFDSTIGDSLIMVSQDDAAQPLNILELLDDHRPQQFKSDQCTFKIN